MASTSKSTLFQDNSDEDLDITTNSEYAKKYDTWRQKEVLQKLKDRYGDEVAGDSSSSDDEDEDARELTQDLEKDFYKTLSYLKNKDPSIYDKDVHFFKSSGPTENNVGKTKQKKIEKPMFLRDYERKIIVERGGKLSDDDDDDLQRKVSLPGSMSVVEEQEAIKHSFKAVLQDSDDEGDAWGGLFEARKKTSDDLKKESADYRDWLKGQQSELQDKTFETELKPLHDYWNDPKLDSSEVFLKDYILNSKFRDVDDENHVPTYEEIVHDSDEGLSEDEKTVAKQEEFEHKFNFRFEEPDQEFIKRYPRTMENSLRRKDTRRKEKREEVKERKVAQKERMREDLKQMKALKRKEIMDKIEKLKEITGNAHVGFEDDDLEGDFDPDAYDKRMSELFSQEYYGEGEEEKPELPGVDEELELENWDEWGTEEVTEDGKDHLPHCEDPDFNMDCDYDPTAQLQAELIDATKKKKRGRKSKLAQALEKKKPVFDPKDRTFEQYVDEYYGMDFEDVIGDLPVRFKYRSVMPNSFGLTVDEILKADDKELNQWCSLKKAVRYLPDYVEKKDFERYERKARNKDYKKKILKSLYIEEVEQAVEEPKPKKKKLKKNKKVDLKVDAHFKAKVQESYATGTLSKSKVNKHEDPAKRKIITNSGTPNASNAVSKKRKIGIVDTDTSNEHVVKKRKSNNGASATITNTPMKSEKKKKKKKKSKGKILDIEQTLNQNKDERNANIISRRKKKNKKLAMKRIATGTDCKKPDESKEVKIVKPKIRRKMPVRKEDKPAAFSDARLQAYGLHPKKFNNYLKYGKKERHE